MTAFYKHKPVGPRGFSEWTNPDQEKFLMACCDCGLVHELQFRPFRKVTVYSDGSYEMQHLPRTAFGVAMRARRADGHTAKLRRRRQVERRCEAQGATTVNARRAGAEMARPDEQNPASRSSLPNRSVLPREPS